MSSTTTIAFEETPSLRGAALAARFHEVRAETLALVQPLEPEDMCIQTMPDVSPTKWHLAHTAWFFERFVLKEAVPGYREHHPRYDFLFNSYYQSVGPMHARPRRGHLSRPTVREVLAYRAHVDAAMGELLAKGAGPEVERVIELGLHHEQQHQELLLSDIKHVLAQSPLSPSYRARAAEAGSTTAPLRWLAHAGGLVEIGHGGGGFAFDNEGPRHRVYAEPFELASRPVTCGEYRAFLEDDGYARPELWLSDGWETVQREGLRAPLYWTHDGGAWQVFTLAGLLPLDDDEPVCHLSFLEADAYARWAGARLPSEVEWEVMAACAVPHDDGGLAGDGRLHPRASSANAGERGLSQLLGGVWEWTQSAYAPYPGFRPLAGSLGEYNGKFMCNQIVLRGGSCFTPARHVRVTYRNFFHAPDRWQMTGVRLARDAR